MVVHKTKKRFSRI